MMCVFLTLSFVKFEFEKFHPFSNGIEIFSPKFVNKTNQKQISNSLGFVLQIELLDQFNELNLYLKVPVRNKRRKRREKRTLLSGWYVTLYCLKKERNKKTEDTHDIMMLDRAGWLAGWLDKHIWDARFVRSVVRSMLVERTWHRILYADYEFPLFYTYRQESTAKAKKSKS